MFNVEMGYETVHQTLPDQGIDGNFWLPIR